MSYISAIIKNNEVHVWERGETDKRMLKTYKAPYYFYYDDKDGTYITIYNTTVSRKTCNTQQEFTKAKNEFRNKGIQTWESDILPDLRVLSNEYYNIPAPKLHTTFLDIEVDYDPLIGFSSPINPYAPINSISLIHAWSKQLIVLCVPPEEGWTTKRLEHEVTNVNTNAPIPTDWKIKYIVCNNETELLLNLLVEIEDTDVMSGWNSDFFDIPYIAQRILRVLDNEYLDLSVNSSPPDPITKKVTVSWNEDPNVIISKSHRCKYLKKLDFDNVTPLFRIAKKREDGQFLGVTLDTFGRIRVDYMTLYKKYEVSEKPSYKLESISNTVLVDDKTQKPLLPKISYEGSLADLYRNNFPFFVRYNIRDTEILYGFEQKLGYIELANQMYHISTGLMAHVTGTIKLTELAAINYCHHIAKRVVNNITSPDVDRQIAGALVLLPQIGMQENIGSIDINSLYPSVIRSINISPETLIGQFADDENDAKEIANGSIKNLTLVYNKNNIEQTMSADEWWKFLKQKRWTVSGYGTIFDQNKQGFIPALLTEWYITRKKYQKLKLEAQDRGDYETAGYYDRLQFVYKIKLNSAYGALTNVYFRFYDLRMGESTTATGRAILKHQCRKVAEILEGNYNIEFPLYETVKDAMKSGYSFKIAEILALDGPLFNGQFQSDAVVYGDTDSTYFKTYCDNINSAIKIADAIAEKVNTSYQHFMQETFVCSQQYDDIIKCGREIVSDRGIFVEKKRYILHLVNLDNKPVDKMKIMGLDTKKTTLPAEVSVQLNSFIERYLKGEPWKDVSLSIVEYKDKLTNTSDITLVGLPKGVKNVEKYTKKYEKDENTFLPGHVAASIYYNICLKTYNDNTSMPIVSNMKIKVFYLLGKHGKFKSIALPTDVEVIPQWFLENFQVDKAAHIERLVDNPLENILKAIKKESPTRQSMFIDNVLEF